MTVYEQMLDRDLMWALREGSMHFEKESAVHRALLKIAGRLDELGVSYAIAGGMALFFHGYRRFTEDVDILVRPEGLAEIHRRLDGLGYVPPFQGSRNLRDTETGVRIEFIVTGQYPGDGKPTAVAFPDPAGAGIEVEGVRLLRLECLLELKLASGAAPGRLRDLADVLELIRILQLPVDFRERLDASVRERYDELWSEVQHIRQEE